MVVYNKSMRKFHYPRMSFGGRNEHETTETSWTTRAFGGAGGDVWDYVDNCSWKRRVIKFSRFLIWDNQYLLKNIEIKCTREWIKLHPHHHTICDWNNQDINFGDLPYQSIAKEKKKDFRLDLRQYQGN